MSSYYNNDTLIEQDILITELRQQLAEDQADRDAIKKEWEKAYEIGMLAKQQLASCQAALADTEALEIGTGERLAKVEQQLAAALAACKLKDESLEAAHNGLRWWMDAFPLHVTEADNEEMLKLVKALTIQPDDSALKAWLEMSNTADCRSQSSLQGVVK